MIIHGDCIEQMAEMEESSVDAIVTDPPYGLEFMGKEWDNFKGGMWTTSHGLPTTGPDGVRCGMEVLPKPKYRAGQPYQQWTTSWATEALRVLKPGGSLLSFGGTRTFHRLTCGLEDAGFIVKDVLCWLYGCLSEDTELLVDGEWVPYHRAIEGSLSLCYNMDEDRFEWLPIQEVFVYDYTDTAYRIKSDSTDQIVSRNHRVIVERDGERVFQQAEELAGQVVCVPILESLRGVPEALSSRDKRTKDEKQNMWEGLLAQVARGTKSQERATHKTREKDNLSLFCLRGTHNEIRKSPKSRAFNLLKTMQRRFERARVEGTCPQRKGCLDRGQRTKIQREDGGTKQPRMERWSHLLQNAWQLFWREVCEVSYRVSSNGAERRICYGASPACVSGTWATITEERSGTSRRPRSNKQLTQKLDAVCQQSGAQTQRTWTRHKTTLATVTPIHYEGIVWCIKVPTGAFVARRNGQIFVTGNSGFPKAQDLGKMIDKRAGVEGEKIPNPLAKQQTGQIAGKGLAGAKSANETLTLPAADLAQHWDGYKIGGIKPAWEPIIWAVKKPEGTYIDNVLKHGVGAVNVEECRIAGDVPQVSQGVSKQGKGKRIYGGGNGYRTEPNPSNPSPKGRFPANLLLSHSPECRQVGVKRVKGGAHKNRARTTPHAGGHKRTLEGGDWSGEITEIGYADPDGKEEVEAWECVDDCPVKMLDEQSGELKSGVFKKRKTKGLFQGGDCEMEWNGACGDTGGASRFFYCSKANKREPYNDHPTLKPVKLMEHLVRLVTRPGQLVLDPFMGSGTTLVAAIQCGREAIGIEQDRHYCDIAERRVGEVQMGML